MKRFRIFAAALLLPAALLIACGEEEKKKDSSSYEMSVLPSKFSADIPASISGDATVSPSMRAVAPGTPSQGCANLRAMTAQMKMFTTMPAVFTVIADAAITQNHLTADGTEHNINVTITSAMANTIAAICADLSDDEFDDTELNGMIGYPLAIKLTYRQETGTYAYSVTIDDQSGTEPITIYWNSDKTKTKMEINETNGSIAFTYDDTEKMMKLIIDFGTSKMTMTLKEEGAGALFYCNYEDGSNVFRIEGFADDNGGYVKTTIITDGVSSTTSTEYFDANGLITASNTTYSDEYNSNSDVIVDLQNNNAYSMTAGDLTEGEYLVYSDTTWDGDVSTIDDTKVVGYGKVTGGRLTIENIGGDAYAGGTTAGATVRLYKATTAFFGESAPTFESTSAAVTIL